jgi:hypothetical protein
MFELEEDDVRMRHGGGEGLFLSPSPRDGYTSPLERRRWATAICTPLSDDETCNVDVDATIRWPEPTICLSSSGFRVQGSGSRVQGSGFRVQGPGFRVECCAICGVLNQN